MPGSTLSSTIAHGITLGGGTYVSPLTISAAGVIAPAGTAETGLYAAYPGGYVLNAGSILAGTGTTAAAGGIGSIGGVAVDLVAGSLTNTGFISGGKAGRGGAARYGGAGGVGGYGVDIAGGSLTNLGSIIGGRGGSGGAAIYSMVTSYAGGTGGTGGAGVHLSAGLLVNNATIFGGAGGPGGAGSYSGGAGSGGDGGVGVDATGGTLVNNATIVGGTGGGSGTSNPYGYITPTGTGAIGVLFHAGGTLTNAGFIGHGTGAGTIAADAVYFGTGAARLILSPTASFNGLVIADAAFGDVLELASGTAVGTLSGFGSEYRGFTTLAIDAAARWNLAGSASLGSAGSLVLYGTLNTGGTLAGIAAISVVSGGALISAGTITGVANRTIAVSGSMTNAGVLVHASGGALLVHGSLNNTGMITSALGAGISVDGSFLNVGTIIAGTGTQGATANFAAYNGGDGGNAIRLTGGGLTNSGTIRGGSGGVGGQNNYGDPGGTGGAGGAGVTILTGSVTNVGAILGGGGGSGGQGYHQVGAPGIGGAGVLVATGGTLANGGLIAGGGNGGDAVDFGTGAARLVLDPGASFSGSVVADASLANVLELASAATAGSIVGLGSAITGFGTIAFDSGASWSIAGSSPGIAAGETIAGFAQHDTIELTGFTATSDTFTGAGLVLAGTGGPKTIGIQGAFTTASFNVTTASGNTYVALQPPCFAAGTRIATARGDIPVEALRIGDHAILPDRGSEPVVWIGRRAVNCARHPEPRNVWPVRITANTFGPGQPQRDLYLSPDHAIFIDDVLVPVKYLIDGAAIAQVRMNAITYYHVELPHHAVLLADGLPVESYLDTGDRAAFGDDRVIALHADFSSRLWEARGCAPLVVAGPKLDMVRRMLRERAMSIAAA